jgi:hypothetical protein
MPEPPPTYLPRTRPPPWLTSSLNKGRLDEADRVLARYRIPPEADHLLLQPIRAARARLRIAQGRAGDHERARQLAAGEVALAESLDQPRTHGIALRTVALIGHGSERIDLLKAAIAQLERSDAHASNAPAH